MQDTKEIRTEQRINKRVVVVNELPSFPMRHIEDNGEEIECVTTNEALLEILETVRELKKDLIGSK